MQQTHIFGRGSRHLDPGLGEEGTGAKHEGDVDDGVDRVFQNGAKRLRGREIVAKPTNGIGPGRSAARSVLDKQRRL